MPTRLSNKLSLDDSASPCCSKARKCTSEERLSRMWENVSCACKRSLLFQPSKSCSTSSRQALY